LKCVVGLVLRAEASQSIASRTSHSPVQIIQLRRLFENTNNADIRRQLSVGPWTLWDKSCFVWPGGEGRIYRISVVLVCI
jgi:hypothetical protein